MSEITIPQSWATSREQICDFCNSKMVVRRDFYDCPKCGNARQKALIRWLRRNLKRA